MILDTSFIIDLMNGDEGAVDTAQKLEHSDALPKIPTMTLMELYIGVGYLEDGNAELDKIKNVVSSLPIIHLDDGIAKRAGLLTGELKRNGESISRGDAVIGSTAAVYNEPVLTANVNEFERIEGLKVETY